MNIYPTFLYIKQHSITGLKYFGKTTKDPYTYNGSGKHWIRHIKKHGIEHIETIWVSESYTDSALISEFALSFSIDNDIVKSKDWANLILENGLDGGSVKGRVVSSETKAKLSASRLGKHHSNETKAKLSGKPRSEETKAKISAALLGKPLSEETKAKISAALLGKPLSEETKARMSAAKARMSAAKSC